MDFDAAVIEVVNSPDSLTEIVGAAVESVAPLAGGTVSPVYQLTLVDGDNLVLKFGEDANTLRAEQLFLEQWSKSGIRTPSVYKRANVKNGENSVTYLLMEQLPGKNLFPLMESGTLDNSAILRDLGRMLAQMHQCAADGYGEIQFDRDGASARSYGKWSTLAELLTDAAWADAILTNQRNGELSEEDNELIDHAVLLLNRERAGRGSSFVHNDFRAGNIIYNESKPQPYAVIDPGPEFTHPYLCLAYSLLLEEVHGANDPADLRRGYGDVSPIDDAALHAALFLRSLLLLPRWGKADQPYAKPLHALFQREKAWLKNNFS